MINTPWTGPNAFRALWHASPDAMALTDATGMVLAANPSYCALHGFSPKGLNGRSLAVTFPASTRPAAMAHYRAVFASQNNPDTYPAAIQYRDAAGRLMESRIDFITRDNGESLMLSSVRVLAEGPKTNSPPLDSDALGHASRRTPGPEPTASFLVSASGVSGPASTPEMLIDALKQWGVEIVLDVPGTVPESGG